MRILSLLLLCLVCVALAGAAPDERIGFVELRFTESGAEVVSVATAPGRLKRRRSAATPPPGHLAVEVEAGNRAVWNGALADPLVQRREFVNEAGALESRVERVEEATVTVRIPAVAARQTVAFYRPSADGRTVATRVEVSL